MRSDKLTDVIRLTNCSLLGFCLIWFYYPASAAGWLFANCIQFIVHTCAKWTSQLRQNVVCLASTHLCNDYTVFIQIDAHALIDAHPLHHQALGTQKWVTLMIFYRKYMDWWWIIHIFAIFLFSDDVFQVKFPVYHFVSTSCLAHAQWASIWINMVCTFKSGHLS